MVLLIPLAKDFPPAPIPSNLMLEHWHYRNKTKLVIALGMFDRDIVENYLVNTRKKVYWSDDICLVVQIDFETPKSSNFFL